MLRLVLLPLLLGLLIKVLAFCNRRIPGSPVVESAIDTRLLELRVNVFDR